MVLCFRSSQPSRFGLNPTWCSNLTELIPLIEPQSHSTPEHNLQVHEESDQVDDPAGIKHSFAQSIEPSFVNVSALLDSPSFNAPHDNSNDQTLNEPENDQRVVQDVIAPIMRERDNVTPDPGDGFPQDAVVEETCTSPFSKFLVQAQGNLA